MKVSWKNGIALVTGIVFDAKLCLIDSAQSFIWREHENGYCAALFDAPVFVEPIDNGLKIGPINENQLEDFLHYLDLSRDYERLKHRYEMYPQVMRSFEAAPGLRVLNQPIWDTLLSFILSANNNVPRIRKLVWILGEYFGEGYRLGDLTLHALPKPEVLAKVSEPELRALGFGYRAPFLIKTAQMVADGFPMESLPELPYGEALQLLRTLPGVGDKVANCVLLFSCSQSSAFPVDVWVARLMCAWFPEFRTETNRSRLARVSRELLGDEAGIVQQFMFHCARVGLISLDTNTNPNP